MKERHTVGRSCLEQYKASMWRAALHDPTNLSQHSLPRRVDHMPKTSTALTGAWFEANVAVKVHGYLGLFGWYGRFGCVPAIGRLT